MSKPWGGAGAWAADAELEEAEAKHAAAASFGGQEAFPTLGQALSSKPQKKKKNQAVSLSELITGKYVGPGGKSRQVSDAQKLTPQEMLMLPTGPRDRSDEHPQNESLGGGFKDYGGYRDQDGGSRDGERDRGGDSTYGGERRRRFGGGYDREDSSGRNSVQDDGPSRADQHEDWGANKHFVSSKVAGGFDDRRGAWSSDRDLPCRADEVENWGSSNKFTATNGSDRPFHGSDRRSSGFGFGKGYEEASSRRNMYEEALPRKGGYEEAAARGSNSRADDAGDWGSMKRFAPSALHKNRGGDYPGTARDHWSRRDYSESDSSNSSERPRLVLQPRSRGVHDDETLPPNMKSQKESSIATFHSVPKEKSNPFGAARPREEVLLERGQDHSKSGDLSAMEKGSRPSSSHSSRPATPDLLLDLPVKPRPKVNPFGDAKPREVLLQEKGRDWRKIDFDLEHRSVDRPLSEEEKRLKEDLNYLLELEKNKSYCNGDTGNAEVGLEEQVNDAAGENQSIQKQIYEIERELEQLTRALDEKVRYSQKGGERAFGRSEAGTGNVYEPPRSQARVADVWSRQSNVDGDRSGRDSFNDMHSQI